MEAARLDIPVRRVISDLAIISISQQLPKSKQELGKIRGLEKQKIRNETAEAILDAIKTQTSNNQEHACCIAEGGAQRAHRRRCKHTSMKCVGCDMYLYTNIGTAASPTTENLEN